MMAGAARFRTWIRGHKLGAGIGVAFVAATGGSAVIWVTASDGTKQADLGSSLLGGLVVGFILLLVGRQINETRREGQSNEALHQLPDSPPAEDPAVVSPVIVPLSGSAHFSFQATATGQVVAGRTFQVVYESAQRDTSRLDAQQIRLRLFEVVVDQTEPLYFQFVTIPVPSPDLRRYVGADPNVTEGRLWWHISTAIQPRLVDAVQRGDIPTATPSFAYEVANYDLRAAVQQARHDPDPEHEVKVNEVIYAFTAPSLSRREDELAMQIRQIVGYDSALQPLVPDGPRRYKMVLERSLPPAEERRLEELALDNGVQIEFHHDGDQWTVGSASS
jgi:hypothetical protein